jgi:hypothetical protein
VVLPGEPAADLTSRATWGECFTEDGLACVGGSCVRAPAEGAACLAGAFCARGLDCDAAVCRRLPATGEACTGDCAPGAYCSATSVCVPELAVGAACTEEDICGSGECGRDGCTVENCASACQSPTLGAAHGSAQECSGTIQL